MKLRRPFTNDKQGKLIFLFYSPIHHIGRQFLLVNSNGLAIGPSSLQPLELLISLSYKPDFISSFS